jgi:hypothetical protein
MCFDKMKRTGYILSRIKRGGREAMCGQDVTDRNFSGFDVHANPTTHLLKPGKYRLLLLVCLATGKVANTVKKARKNDYFA